MIQSSDFASRLRICLSSIWPLQLRHFSSARNFLTSAPTSDIACCREALERYSQLEDVDLDHSNPE